MSAALLVATTIVCPAETQVLHARVPAAAAKLKSIGELAPAKQLNLVIALPLRNREELTNLLQQLYDPRSPNFRHYVTPQQFSARFGPTEKDYQAVKDFAIAHGLSVTGTHRNRALLDVSGSVADIEKTFKLTLRVYSHPTEARTFYAPDREPSVDLGVPLFAVEGLDDYVLPRPMYHHIPRPAASGGGGEPAAGSGPSGTYMGNDFRAAYVPNLGLTGSGQSVGLFELDGYYTNDPVLYALQAGLTNVIAPTNVLVDSFDGTPGADNVEVALDIEMVMAMAPGAQVIVYEASPATAPTAVIDVLNRMADDDVAEQLSSSWQYETGPAMDQTYQQMAAQGQSFFNASGDHGAYSGPVTTPSDDPYITIVGGTTLSTSGPGSNWVSETTWNFGDGNGSGGGISTVWPIPSWQQGVDMSSNNGSTSMRNLPDVAMVADAIYAVADNSNAQFLAGTSISTPLWAAFTSLVNQQAALQSQPAVGFLNPALYVLGEGTNYNTLFNDITNGNNTTSSSPTNFFAVPGYDLCTGWGSPTTNLIEALLNVQFVLPNGWTLTSLGNESWSCVASSSNGQELVAADESGAHPFDVSYNSGATWRSFGPGANWRGIACSADGTKLVAADWGGGPVYISTDSGATWTASGSPLDDWNSAGCSADGSKQVAASYWQVIISTNFFTTSQTIISESGGMPMPVAYSGDGNVLLVGYGSQVYVSTNGGTAGTWSSLSISSIRGVAASYDGSTLVAAGSDSICVSTNFGASWTLTSAPGEFWSSVACSADGYRIVAAPNGGNISLSDDRGATWVGIGPRIAAWSSIACSSDGTQLIVAANDYLDGPVYTGIFPRVAPIITVPPADTGAVVGDNAEFSVSALGPAPLTYQWSFNGTNIAGATNNPLILTNVQFAQAGYYGVEVSDVYGSRFSPNAVLTVVPPPATIFVQPTNQTAVLGTTVSFSVTALGAPPLTYQWTFNGTNIDGATSNVLTLFDVQETNAGAYSVTVANGYGSVTSSNAVLTLLPSTPCLPPPANLLSWWPGEGNADDRAGTNNGTVVGNVGYGPGYVGQSFVFDGTNGVITVGNRADIQPGALTVDMWVKRSSTSVSTLSGGAAVLFSIDGSVVGLGNDGDPFWDNTTPIPPSIFITDTNWHNLAITATSTGDSIYVDGVSVGGSEFPQSFAFANVTIGGLGGASPSETFYGSLDEVTLFNRALTPAEILAIYSQGTNGMCWLPAPPCIVDQPASQTVPTGSVVTFSVGVSGWLQSLSYQWQFDGTNMIGMTNSSVTLTTVQTSQAGNYDVVITNIYGVVTSSNATLSVQTVVGTVTNAPVFGPLEVLANGTVQGQLTGSNGLTTVETSSNLINWVPLTNVMLTNNTVPFFDPSATNFRQRFYRAQVP